jgi:hypothetical protein
MSEQCGKLIDGWRCVLRRGHPHGCTETGDTFRRNFTGNTAQCGCSWSREVGFGDVLHQCPIHQAAADARRANGE